MAIYPISVGTGKEVIGAKSETRGKLAQLGMARGIVHVAREHCLEFQERAQAVDFVEIV